MTTSQPPDAVNPDGGPGQPATPSAAGAVRITALIGAVLALGCYLCGFFGGFLFVNQLIIVLAGGILAVLGLLPKVGRVLVPAAVLSATGFFALLLAVTSPISPDVVGSVRWVALGLALLSAAGVVAALMFDVGVLFLPTPRPAPAPPGWNQYGQPGQPGYGGPGYPGGGYPPQPGAVPGQPGQPGLFEQGYANPGAPGGYGYGAPGQPGQTYGTGYPAQGYPAQPGGGPGYGGPATGAPQASGAYGAVPGYGSPSQQAPGYGNQPGFGTGAGYPGSNTPTAAGSGAGSYGEPGSLGDPVTSATGAVSGPTLGPGSDAVESTTPGVPASHGDDDPEIPDERTRSFRPADGGPSGS